MKEYKIVEKNKKESFIKCAKKKYGSLFDYSKINYINNSTKIRIFCKKHNKEFFQRPDSHLKNNGCPFCQKENYEKKINDNKQKFIEKCRLKYKDTYNYDNIEYKNSKTKILIFCEKHKKYFWQTPSYHLKVAGCPKCKEENVLERKKDAVKKYRYKTIEKRKESFIEKAKNIYGNKFDYSKINYVNNTTKIFITCKTHNTGFWQTPHCHLRANGCPKCQKEAKLNKVINAQNKFIHDSIKIFNNFYDYSKVNYLNNETRVKIICPIHGEFEQLPNNHLQGCGCPKCNSSRLEIETENLLKQNHIYYQTQKRFNWLIGHKNGKMSLDFFLPDYNIAIECQGIQHYTSNNFYTEKIVSETKQRDILKKHLCDKHNIQIFYIRYDDNIKDQINNLIKLLCKNAQKIDK